MTTQPEALRLAECLDEPLYATHKQMTDAAAELRRLHQFSEDQIGRATAAEAALQMTKATHALKIAAVEAQRDALLEALKEVLAWGTDQNYVRAEAACDKARAVIKAVEDTE